MMNKHKLPAWKWIVAIISIIIAGLALGGFIGAITMPLGLLFGIWIQKDQIKQDNKKEMA